MRDEARQELGKDREGNCCNITVNRSTVVGKSGFFLVGICVKVTVPENRYSVVLVIDDG